MSELGSFVKELRNIMKNDAGINGDAQRIEQIVWMLFLKVYDAKEENEWELEDDYVSIIPENCKWRNWAKNTDKLQKDKKEKGSALTGEELLNFVNNTLFPTLKKLEVTAETPTRQAIVRTMFEDANQYMKDGVLLRQMLNEIDNLDFSDYQESHAFGEIYESILKELQSAGSSGEFYTPRAVTDFMAQMIQPKIGEQMADFACGTGGFLVSWLKALEKIGFNNTDEQQKAFSSVYGIEKKQFPYMLAITNMLLHDVDEPNIFHGNSLLHPVLDYSEKDQFDVILMNPPYGGSEKEGVKKNFPDNLASSETADLFLSVIMYRLKQNGRAGVILPDGFLFGTDNAKIEIKKKLLNDFHLHTVIRMPQSVFSPYTSITTNILFFDRTGKTDAVWFYRLDMPEGYKHFSKTKPMKLEHFAPVVDWWQNRSEIRDIKSDDAMTETWKSRQVPVQEIIENGYSLDFCGFPNEEKIILSPEETIMKFKNKREELDRQMDEKLAEILELLGVATE